MSAGGEGMVVFDVCSGKGLGAMLLSFLLPQGRVVMLDSNGGRYGEMWRDVGRYEERRDARLERRDGTLAPRAIL